MVTTETKQKMANVLLSTPQGEIHCGKPLAPPIYFDSNLEDFIRPESWLFFKLCKLEPQFLKKKPWIGQMIPATKIF